MDKTSLGKTIIFYKDEKENVPARDWLFGLKDTQARRKILRRLRNVEQGYYGDFKRLTGFKELMELRFDFGPGYRFYFAEEGLRLVVLLVGGSKKTQTKDINKAEEYWNDYKENRNYEELSNA